MTKELAVKLMFERHLIVFKDAKTKEMYDDTDSPVSDDLIIQYINLDGEVTLFDNEKEDVIYDIPCECLSPKL